MMNRLLLLLLCLVPALVCAEIYRTVDENGTVVFTDRPTDVSEAQQIKLQHTNRTAPPPTALENSAAGPDEAQEPAESPYNIAILTPENESTIPMGAGNFDVSAMIRPSLGSNTQIQLMLDGEPLGALQRHANWSLAGIARGAHDITVAIVNQDGEQLAISAPTRIYVMRPSLNNPPAN